jgi:polyhydroxybutyrate depolymerase
VITVMPAGLGDDWDFAPDGVDVALFDAINDFLGPRLCIDERRRFVQGASGGAVMSYTLGCVRAEQIAGIAAVAGRLETEVPPCAGNVAAFLVHGQTDPTVPFADGEASRDELLARNGCSDSQQGHPSELCTVFDDCAQADVVWCEHEGGHIDHITLELRDDVLAFFQSIE